MLRSKSSETDFVWRIYEIAWAWRSAVPSPFRRSLPFALLAILNMAIFLVAGIFSARVTITESQGLVLGKCGWLEETANKDFPLWTPDDWAAGDALFVSAYNGYKTSMTYAQNCYAGSLLNASDITCKEAVIPYIKSTTNTNSPCPFADGICTGPAFTIDSGPISSDTHLGINTRDSSRVIVRKATTCAPLNMDAFSTPWKQEPEPGTEMFLPVGVPNDTYKYYFMGPSLLSGYTVSDFTFIVSNYSLFVNGLPYTWNARTSYAKNFTEGGFFPVPALNRTDADVTIFTLNNRVAYTGEVMDPLYRANLQTGGNRLAEAWMSNSTLTGIACTEQYQFCNPALPSDYPNRCTPLSAMYDFNADTPPSALQLTARQSAVYRILRSMIYFMRMNMVVTFLKNEILIANKLVYGSFGISTILPDNQWHIEVANIHNITLAGLQANAITHASNPNMVIRPGLNFLDHIVPETDLDSQHLCRNQRVKVTRYSSFSMLGILIIIFVSAIIILTDMYLPWLVSKSTKSKQHNVLSAWEEDDMLQLQRQALELRGVGPWKEQTDEKVPVTEGWDIRFKRGGRDGDKAYSGLVYAKDSSGISNEAFEPLAWGRKLSASASVSPALGSPYLTGSAYTSEQQVHSQGHGEAMQLGNMPRGYSNRVLGAPAWL